MSIGKFIDSFFVEITLVILIIALVVMIIGTSYHK